MSELKAVGYVKEVVEENSVKIVIDEKYAARLPELSEFNYVIIGSLCEIAEEEKLLREIFGPEAREVRKVKLISIAGNVVEVEKFDKTSKLLETQIIDIHPLYPEDDIPDADETPGWLKALDKKPIGQFLRET